MLTKDQIRAAGNFAVTHIESVDLKYFMKVLREHRAENNYQSLRLLGDLITDDRTWFSDDRVYWERREL